MKRLAIVCLLLCAGLALHARDDSDATYFAGMRWRLIGPNRAGRVWWVAGVPGDPSVYYLGTPAGALWKSTSGGTRWTSISDAIPVTGFGAIAVAPSDSEILYAGTGSNTLGNGVYRSNDAGATWHHAGLADTKYITGLIVDPRNPDVVVAAAGNGGNFGSMVFYNNNPSPARGVYRTTDGGRTWAHTLFVDASSSVVDLVSDSAHPDVLFASLSASAANAQAGPPVYRSNDHGVTWERLAARGLPPGVGVTLAVAPGTDARRLYALAGGRGGGMYRSDDGGLAWTLTTSRLASAGGRVYVDPRNPDVVYTMGTSVYRSTDGGRTLEAIKGAPGGDDPHSLWIDPQNPRRMIMGADQGPAITLDGGSTWTPWYTVPNGEFYFVSTDQQFPYRVYVAQQDSGTVSILSRSDYGAIRPNDWYPVSGYEQGHIFADPLNPRYVYSHGNGHAIVRFDRETGQSGPVYTPASQDRFGPRPGMDLSLKDPRWMFVGAQYVLASSDRVTWTRISPDLTAREDRSGAGGRPGTGTIVALAASPLDLNVLWAGTSNGLVHVTRDRGTTWTNVSPPRLAAEPTLTLWSMEASHRDAAVAYATAIDLSDRHAPCIFTTTDFGATWRPIVDGLPAGVPTRVVREDPERPGLLYAGTQAGVFVSFDGGGRWEPLQLNLPRVAVNDITVHGDDLVIATWGRGLWILDDVTPLRQFEDVRNAASAAFLLTPAQATRVRWDNNQDTPLPPEVLAGENAPDGAIIDYYLRSPASGTAIITIRDAQGEVVRAFSSVPAPPDTRMPNVPEYWFKRPDVVEATPGMHRVVWDLRYPTPPPLEYGADGNPSYAVSYGIIAPAVIGQSPRQQPVGPLVLPGTYRVTLTVDGHASTRDLHIVNDPRSTASTGDLAAQVQYERTLAHAITVSHDAIEQIRSLRQAAASRAGGAPAQVQAAVATFDRAALAAIGSLAGGRPLTQHLAALEFADMRPTASTMAAIGESCGHATEALARFHDLLGRELVLLNGVLKSAGLAGLPTPAGVGPDACPGVPPAVSHDRP